ncbi:MAG: imidazole glycerol phosphate synthase subunit HisH [Clostridium sp.]|nr:imidazole glycerol phosphate synthase subunit HisH [Clostridium sp.]
MIVIVDYGMGNLYSVKNMLKYLGYDSVVTDSMNEIEKADRLILPGVGNFGKAMSVINESGLRDILNRKVLEEKIPILGICLGMQLFLEYSEEGNCEGLGWINGDVRRFELDGQGLKIPHMGWDYIERQHDSELLVNPKPDERYYFVHSYYVTCKDRNHAVATTEYGITFDSVIQKENIAGTQFHPEKSHKFGMNILKNFVENFYVS